ncbi:hypothetical protein [Paracnuella aquatica]|uniref:hypothetical protein n=1 Tax=Paracnuella aquatica TaxID=2268757 RepID=UPI000DEF9F69|nr:hypothetical protein [Paracnuella aquatica]RPD43444.1 hypothetical protein DRJ53_20120 [Paracnuella aquatica]
MYNISETDKEFALLLKDKIKDFERDFEKNFFTQEATLELLSLGVNLSDTLNYSNNKIVWNIACFVNITSYDLKIIVKAMVFSKREWEKRLFARQAALLVYETMNDLFDLLGKDFRRIISKLTDKEIFEACLKEITKDLNLYKASYFNQLKKIRNVSIAHRDKDTLEQLRTIQSIEWVDSINMVSGFDKILNKTGKLLQDLTGKSKDLDQFK